MEEQRYTDWIQGYVHRHADFVRGQCENAVKEMVAAFPELRMAKGHVETEWGKDAHWWCVAPDGSIVDPTVSQFPWVLDYEEYRAGDKIRIGRCTDCGEPIWAVPGDDTRPDFCNDNCATSYVAYINASLR